MYKGHPHGTIIIIYQHVIIVDILHALAYLSEVNLHELCPSSCIQAKGESLCIFEYRVALVA